MSEPKDNEVKQTANAVGGDQAGRDVNKPTYNYYAPASPMARMIEKFRHEKKQNQEIRKTIEHLERWFKSNGDVMGIEEKLRRGHRPDIIELAIEAKDRFAKCLIRHQYSPAAQEIYAFLLAKTHQLFSSIIYPEICAGARSYQINQLLVDQVYGKVESMLEDNPLGITPEEVMGMMYWLTGNCHLKWSKNADLQPHV